MSLILALALGGAGGVLFWWMHLPLPWMLGALCACGAASLSGLRPAVPMGLRAAMMVILGLMLGSAFTPQLVGHLPGWWPSMLGLLLASLATLALCMRYLVRFANLDAATAFFAAAPGGINEMVLVGGKNGGDERVIASIHALRIVFIVFAVPVGFRLVTHVQGQSMTVAMGSLAQLSWSDGAMLLAAGVIGLGLGRLLRFPAPALTGPMAASAFLHLAHLSTAQPPAELIILAQWVTGSALGSRFVGIGWRDLAATARIALGSTLIMIFLAGGLAFGLDLAGIQGFGLLLLAFVPGGIAEMCLIALAMGQDVAFVSAHHLVRVVLVIFAAPVLFRLVVRGLWALPTPTKGQKAL